MDLILCHQTVDFDALGSAVGLSKLKTGARIVLTGGAHPGVKNFLALYRDEFPFLELRSVHPQQIRSLSVVDNQRRDRLGKAGAWCDRPQIQSFTIYDHHRDHHCDLPATHREIEALGAITTLIVEKLQAAQISLRESEATVMALGIHVDTGSLTFDQTTPRDARALAWLMEQGANVKIIGEYVEPSLSPHLQQLFTEAIAQLQRQEIHGYTIGTVLLQGDHFVAGLSNMAEKLINFTELDALVLAHRYYRKQGEAVKAEHRHDPRLAVIGRSRIEETNLHQLFQPYGGGGHPQAASLSTRTADPQGLLQQICEDFMAQIPTAPTARDIMSSPVRTILPETTIEQAQRILFRYGHSGLSVVDDGGQLVGVISRRDLDLAIHHGFSHAPVKGYMARHPKTITPQTPLPAIENLMVTYDVGRLPVLQGDRLQGIVTRTDVLRQLHQENTLHRRPHLPIQSHCFLPGRGQSQDPLCDFPRGAVESRFDPAIWELLQVTAAASEARGWHLYLVGGAVRDLLLAEDQTHLLLQDIDLVVDGFHESATVGAGMELAQVLKELYPQVRVSVHGDFQTAALVWHRDETFGSLWVDIATARTEFYPYPAANPEVEASSIRQDLYRRDFTINALAVRLTSPRQGELLDFFGGIVDLRSQKIRVLHANSFIEDPTRIYRAVRFAVRLRFQLEEQTEDYIRYALDCGVYQRLRAENQQAPALTTRLRAELQYLLQSPYWKPGLQLLARLGALGCIDPSLRLTPELWWQLRCVSRWLRWHDRDRHWDHWLLRLELILAALDPPIRTAIAAAFHLPKESQERLRRLESRERALGSFTPETPLSEIVAVLRGQDLGTICVVAARGDRPLRRLLWRYLAQWSKIKAPLDGQDLKAMGYRPGPIFKEILGFLMVARLDHQLSDREAAKRLVLERFPQKTP